MRKNTLKFRHENKYVVTNAQIHMLFNRIEHLMVRDHHAGENGSYSIRSLYFDDYANHCFFENENGTDPREKFRIRIYNHSTEQIKLECKRKERGLTHKESCSLTVEQTRLLMEGKVIPDIESQPAVLRKLTMGMLLKRMRPVIIVEYERIPFVYSIGNVRVTFDMNISSSSDMSRFLDERIPKRPVMPSGHQLLEVKYDELIPDFIFNNLQLDNLQQTAFSKFYMCRKFSR